MRLSPGRGAWAALGVTVVAIGLMFLAATWGLATWSRSQTPSAAGVGALPVAVENAPPGIGTTERYGPLGAVSMVYAGNEVEDGLVGEVARPWVAVGARTGDYRAISAPRLPAPRPGAVVVSPDGDRIAWATGAGVMLYDPATDRTRPLGLEGATQVGAFSLDGTQLTVHAGGLRLLDLGTGQVRAAVEGSEPATVRTAAWRADGSAVDFVSGQDLVTVPANGSRPTTQPSPFAPAVPLTWAPTGDRLVGLQEDEDGIPRLYAAPAGSGGEVGRARRVDTSGISLAGLLGFSGEETVAVSAFLLESGSVERILDVPLDGGPIDDVTTLPPPGLNWQDSATLAVSAAALRAGSTDFGNEVWPWTYRARLAACMLVGLFGLGLWATRRRRSRR